jgi:hypothetical protein
MPTRQPFFQTASASRTPGAAGPTRRRRRLVVARIPLQLRRPLLEAFHDFAVEVGDDHGAIAVLETAPVIRRQRRGWDCFLIEDGPVFYAIHTMLVRIANARDVVPSDTRGDTLATARLARRIADRMRRQQERNRSSGG